MLGEVPAKAALCTQELAVDRRLGVALGVHDLVSFGAVLDRAAHAAVAADRALAVELPLAALLEPRDGEQRGRRADLDAAAAEHTARVDHRAVEGRGDVATKAAVDNLDRVRADHFVADARALAAQDAVLVVADEERVVVLIQRARDVLLESGFGQAIVVRVLLQRAGTGLVAGDAIERVIGDEQIERVATERGQLLALRAHDHAGLDSQTAARHRVGPPLDLDQTQPAAAGGLELGVMAEPRDVDVVSERGVERCRAGFDAERLAVR